MKNRYIFILSLIVSIIGLSTLYNHNGRPVISSITNKKVVVVDVGHGGSDPGKVSANGIKEKDVNLQIALYLKDYLIAMDYTVYLTRETDCGLYDENVSNKKRSDMNNRIRFFSEKGANYIVSIHQNSYPDASQHGAQTFYHETSSEGKLLAEAIQEALLSIDDTNHRNAKSSNSYYLLRKSGVPAVIVECGFLSSPEEAFHLTDANYQKRLAYSIAKGISGYDKY